MNEPYVPGLEMHRPLMPGGTAPPAAVRLVRLLLHDAREAVIHWQDRLSQMGWLETQVDLARGDEESELRRLMREGRLKP